MSNEKSRKSLDDMIMKNRGTQRKIQVVKNNNNNNFNRNNNNNTRKFNRYQQRMDRNRRPAFRGRNMRNNFNNVGILYIMILPRRTIFI
jgi:hypothetical protein